FLFHLKESEFRFNHRNDNLYKVMLKRLRNDPI
ncbi:MAG: IS1595 family transposase, partial [Balneolaceae bacterium]|nr:IS1595 family transposase [Balneolaceae bacterium]